MEVSKTWSDFINVRDGLMNKLIFKPQSDICELPIVKKIFSDENKRRYKHMKGPVGMRKQFLSLIDPLAQNASTLVTLDVEENDEDEPDIPQFTFPKLRKLKYDYNDESDFLENSFPVLTHLKIYLYHRNNFFDIDGVKAFVQKLAKLKVLVLDFGDCFREKEEQMVNVIQKIQDRPELKNIFSSKYFSGFMREYRSSLEKLECDEVVKENIYQMVKDFKALKSLSFDYLLMYDNDFYNIENEAYEGEIEFVRNGSIEILKIRRVIFNNSDNFWKFFFDLMLALPSLKELILYEDVTAPLLKFIG
jgi:hypothetical protein